MGANLLDLSRPERLSWDRMDRLQAYVSQLVGEPFQFARVSYGEELTLHFGELSPARSPRLKGKLYGDYVLGLRGSSWALKSSSTVLMAGEVFGAELLSSTEAMSREELERGAFAKAGCRVLSALPFPVVPMRGFGLQLQFSDGNSLIVLPGPEDPDEPGEEDLPRLADWELLSPQGLLSAGPDLEWSFEPAKADRP